MIRKYYGTVGFSVEVDAGNGIWRTDTVTRLYYGDIRRITEKDKSGKEINSDVSLDIKISILADDFLLNNYTNLLYLDYNNKLYKISSAEPVYNRINVTLGGLYNG